MVFDKIKKIMMEELNVNEEKITLEAQLNDDLGLDSLDAVEILMAIEDEFEVSIDDEVAQNFKSISDLVKHVEELINK